MLPFVSFLLLWLWWGERVAAWLEAFGLQATEPLVPTRQGIYRLSGVKSRVEDLCARFEANPRAVSVDDDDPVTLAAVLKTYLRQLPEPVIPLVGTKAVGFCRCLFFCVACLARGLAATFSAASPIGSNPNPSSWQWPKNA